MPTGSYDPYHLGNTGHTDATEGAGAYLGWWNESHQAHGLFPQTQTELEGMWADKIGVTCIETFFYIARFDNSGMKYQFAVDLRQRIPLAGQNNTTNICGYQLRLTATTTNELRVRFGYVLGDPGTNGWSGNTILAVNNVDNWMSPDEWYHSVLRYNSGANQWEWLVGRLGKNSNGTDAGGTVDSLNNVFWGPGESQNTHLAGSYFRMAQNETDPANGPLLVFMARETDTDDSSLIGSSGLSGFFGTQHNNTASIKLDRSWPGGHCEHRFWKSSINNSRTHAQLENLKNTDVDGDQHSELVHCFRLNETGASLSVADYEDVGTLNGTFESAVSNISSTSPDSGYPYDIVGQGPSGPTEHEASATIVGMARTYQFYGEEFGVDMDGNPAYRDKLFTNDRIVEQLMNYSLEELLGAGGNPVGFRFAVKDYYNGLTYLLPGTGYVSEEPADGATDVDWYINLTSFVCNAGKDVVYSRYWLINAEVLERDNKIQYYASPPNGPHHIVQHETGKIFFGVNLD
jgi:hypothetical protein